MAVLDRLAADDVAWFADQPPDAVDAACAALAAADYAAGRATHVVGADGELWLPSAEAATP